MKTCLFSKSKFLFTLTVSSFIASSALGGQILWHQEFQAGGKVSYSLGAASFDKTENKLVILGTSFSPNEYSEANFMLWEIDPNGMMTKEVTLEKVPENIKSEAHNASRLVKGLSVSRGNRIRAIGKFEGPGKSVIEMNRQGDIFEARSVDKMSVVYEDDLILNTIELPHDGSILIGRNNQDDGLAIKVDVQANKLWEHTYDQGRVEYLTDGVAIENEGYFIAVGGIITPKESLTIENDSLIWVLKCDSKGNIISEQIFSGDPFVRNMPQVSQLSSGEIIVAYTEIHSNTLTLKAFSSDLEELWVKSAYEDQVRVYDYKIRAIPKQGFIIASGFGSTGLRVHKYDKAGHVTTSYSWKKEVRGGNFLLVTSDDNAFVVLQTRAVDENKINNLKVIALPLE